MTAWLEDHGAKDIAHPGGTLYAHLVRIRDRLKELGCSDHVQQAGLLHAVYGTAGFDLKLADRDEIRAMVSETAETLIYRYCACDRDATWPDLATTRTLTNRFTGDTELLSEADTRDLIDLSIVNELDVYEQSQEIADKYGDYFVELFRSWAPAASPSVIEEADRVLSNRRASADGEPGSGV